MDNFIHRLNDDWAYANETRSKSWDFQNEEAALKAAVERFNSRRYSHVYPAFALGTTLQNIWATHMLNPKFNFFC